MKRNRLIGLLSILLLGAIGGAVALQTSAEEVAPPTALKETYVKNERVEVPEKKIEVNGESYDTTAMVVYPDGTSYTVSHGAFDATSAGLYNVVYYAVVDGQYYEEKDSFIVNESAFSVSGKKSSAIYGAHDKYATDQNGIVTKISQGDTFYYNRIINLNDFTSEPVLDFFVTPGSLGTEDARYIKVTFTDIYDPSNTVTIEGRRYASSGDWAHLNTYFVAYANGQEKVGIEPKTSTTGTLINGGYYGIHKNNDYGVYINYSISGVLNAGEEIGDKSIRLYWDYENKTVSAGVNSQKKVISFLDNPLLYSNPWKGFTTGEVFVSISADGYNAPTLDCVITKIGDFDLSDVVVEETTEPFITVDYAGHSENNLPKAAVNVAYPLYNAKAWDFYDGEVAVTSSVYYNYYGDNAYQMPVKNGSFTPDREGWYTIVYRAKNKFGVTTEYLVDVQTLNTTELLKVEITEPTESAVSGTNVQVAQAYTLKNTFGNNSVEITAVLKSNPEVSYKIDKNTLTFVPYYAGTYEIQFKAKDYLKQVTESFDLTVSANPQPFIDGTASLPKYLIAGNTYKIPTEVYGYDLSSGVPVQSRCAVLVYEDSKPAIALPEDGVYTVGDAQNVKVAYTINVNGNVAELAYTRPVVSVRNGEGDLQVQNFFVSSVASTTLSADDDYAYIHFTQDSVVEYINPLRADSFETGFMLPQVGFKVLDVYLTGVDNANERIKISLIEDGTTKVLVNDSYVGEYSAVFAHYASSALNVRYADGVLTVDTFSVALSTYENGERFNGFHGSISFAFGLTGVQSESKLTLVKINNQFFYNFTTDLIEPELSVSRMVGERDRGERITLTPASAYDVLTGYSSPTFSVSHPNGGYVTAEDGTVLNGKQDASVSYTFVLSDFGRYVVSYQAYDGTGNRLRYNYTISCADSVLPEISLSAYEVTAKVGEITIPEVTASDNITDKDDLEIVVTLLLPSGKMVRVENGVFTADKAGKYILFYSVFDEMGHFAQARCEITVTNE